MLTLSALSRGSLYTVVRVTTPEEFHCGTLLLPHETWEALRERQAAGDPIAVAVDDPDAYA